MLVKKNRSFNRRTINVTYIRPNEPNFYVQESNKHGSKPNSVFTRFEIKVVLRTMKALRACID